MALVRKEVLKTNTFEQQRVKINEIGQDLYDISTGEEGFEALKLDGPLLDSQNKTGFSGQVLGSTGTGVLWKTQSISNVLWVTKDGNDNNDGLSEQTAKASIGSALRAANEGYLSKLQDASAQILINKKLIQEESINWLLTDYISRGVGGTEIDASNLILSNKELIANEAVERMLINNSGFTIPGGNQKCVSDVLKVIDTIVFNVRYGGNNKVYDAAFIYADDLTLLEGERVQSTQVYNNARDLAISAMRNQPIAIQGSHTLTQVFDSAVIGDVSGQPGIYNFQNDCASVASTITSLFGIITQSIGTEAVPGSLTGIPKTYPERFTFPNSPPESGRYKDARNLIYRNIDEICDKALAEIAVEYDEAVWGEDWSFPELPLSSASNRYKDAANLIAANKQEIQDRALAQIAINHPDFVFPGQPATDNHSRFADSYRLIQQNRQEIINTAWTSMVALYPGVASTETKCKRDLGYFIDAISLDVFLESNRYSVKFASIYFDQSGNPIPNGLDGEEVESIFAFTQARDLMQDAITNQLTIKDLTITEDPLTEDNQSSNSCANVRGFITTLTAIVTDVISAGSLDNLPPADSAYYTNTFKCYRDIGFFVDAVADDVSFQSNRHVREFILEYFNPDGTPISNGLVGEETESITAFNKARDMMKLAITNQLYSKDLDITADPLTESNISINSCSNIQTLIINLTTIATSIIADGSLDELPEQNNGTYGSPSNRYIDASNLITANKEEIKDRALAQITINHPDFVFPGEDATDNHSRFADSYRLIQQNRQEIIDTAWKATANLYPNIIQTQQKCKRDLGYFIDAISLDVFLQSNRYSIKFASIYFDEAGDLIPNGLDGEQVESIFAFTQARNLMWKAITNQLTIKDSTITADPLTGTNLSPDSCANVRGFITTLTTIVTDVISDGSLDDLPPADSSYYTNTFKCYRDIGFFVDAVALDVSFESNRHVRNFIFNYFNQDGTPISNGLGGEQSESITAFNKARDMMKLAITNQLYSKDLTVTADPLTQSNISINSCSNIQTLINNLTTIATYIIEDGSLDELPEENNGTYESEDSQRFRDSYRLIQKNRAHIINETVTELATNYPAFVNPNETKCRRDIGYYIDAVSLDVYLRGNRYSRKFASFYYTGATVNYLDGEVTESVFAFNAARDLMIQAIKNELPYNDLSITIDTSVGGPCANVQESIYTLGTLIEEVLENGVSALSNYRENRGSFYRSESKCRRDINLIVRSIANDLYIGGNTNTYRAARKYFNENGDLIFIENEAIQSKIAFEKAADLMIMAITNQLYEKNLTLPESSAEYNDGGPIIPYGISGNASTCADVQSNINTLILILSTVIDEGNLSSLDDVPENQGIWNDFENICLRDIGYIVEAVASDLKNGGNINCYNAGRAYYKGNNLDFINDEKQESLATFEKAKELMLYAMRNWDIDPFGTKYKPEYSFFDLYIDESLIIDKDSNGEFLYPLCSDVSSAIENNFNIIKNIIVNGPNSVDQQLPSFKTTVFVKSGVYVEQNPIILPPSTGIVGDNLREVSIKPANATEDLFYLNNGSYITGATFSGHLAPSVIGSFPKVKIGDTITRSCSGTSNEYEITVAYTNDLVKGMTISGQGIGTGAIITNILGDTVSISVANRESFTNRSITFENFIGNTGVITRSPYIQNCTSLTTTGSGLRVDGNLAGGTASFVLDSYTQYNQGGDGIVITNGGYTQLVSIFEICCDRAVYLSGGSTCSITNSNTDFGNYGLVADGLSPLQFTAFVDGNQLRGNTFRIENLRTEPYVGQVATFGNNGKPYYFIQEINITNRGSGYNPANPPAVVISAPTGPSGITAQAIPVIENGEIVSVTLVSSGTQFITAPSVQFVGGATPTTPASAVAKMYPQYYSILTAVETAVNSGIYTVTFDETIPFDISNGTEVYFFQVTKIISNSHCFEYVGAGTKIEEAIPAKGGVPLQEREVVELNGGKVAFTSTDHLGNFRIGTGIQINQNTGTLTGESFEKSLFVTITPFILALS